MDRATFKEIVATHAYGRFAFLDEEEVRARAWHLEPEGDGWRVFRTDRHREPVAGSEQSFATEAEALAHLVTSGQGDAADRRAVAARHRRQHLPAAGPAIKRLRAAVDELREFMLEHDVRRLEHGVTLLGEIAANEDEDPVEVMLAARRALDGIQAVPRDGWSEAYVGDGNDGVDHPATARMDALVATIERILRPWQIEE